MSFYSSEDLVRDSPQVRMIIIIVKKKSRALNNIYGMVFRIHRQELRLNQMSPVSNGNSLNRTYNITVYHNV